MRAPANWHIFEDVWHEFWPFFRAPPRLLTFHNVKNHGDLAQRDGQGEFPFKLLTFGKLKGGDGREEGESAKNGQNSFGGL